MSGEFVPITASTRSSKLIPNPSRSHSPPTSSNTVLSRLLIAAWLLSIYPCPCIGMPAGMIPDKRCIELAALDVPAPYSDPVGGPTAIALITLGICGGGSLVAPAVSWDSATVLAGVDERRSL